MSVSPMRSSSAKVGLAPAKSMWACTRPSTVAPTAVTVYLRTAKPCATACASVMTMSSSSGPGCEDSSATASTQPNSVPATRWLRRSSVCARLPRSTTTMVSRIQ